MLPCWDGEQLKQSDAMLVNRLLRPWKKLLSILQGRIASHWLGVAPNEKVAPNKVKPMLHRGLNHVLKRRSSWIVYRKTLS